MRQSCVNVSTHLIFGDPDTYPWMGVHQPDQQNYGATDPSQIIMVIEKRSMPVSNGRLTFQTEHAATLAGVLVHKDSIPWNRFNRIVLQGKSPVSGGRLGVVLLAAMEAATVKLETNTNLAGNIQ